MPNLKEVEKIHKEIKEWAGYLPDGYGRFSKNAMPGAWKSMKEFELNPNTEIPQRYKELINVAIASQIPSAYCVHSSWKFAEAQGASDEEIGEAVAVAAIVRRFSTFINGIGMNLKDFKEDMDQVVEHIKTLQRTGEKPPTVDGIETSAQAYKDIDHTLGLVPRFFLAYPEPGIAGVWREMKELQLNPDTYIPLKYKELIGLAVSAQIPCQYCHYFHTKVAKLHGATAGEMNEAAALAGSARHWSAAFNGLERNYQEFEKKFDTSFEKTTQKSMPTSVEVHA